MGYIMSSLGHPNMEPRLRTSGLDHGRILSPVRQRPQLCPPMQALATWRGHLPRNASLGNFVFVSCQYRRAYLHKPRCCSRLLKLPVYSFIRPAVESLCLHEQPCKQVSDALRYYIMTARMSLGDRNFSAPSGTTAVRMVYWWWVYHYTAYSCVRFQNIMSICIWKISNLYFEVNVLRRP